MAYQVCRLCFGKGKNLKALNTGENSLGRKLSACVPEINIFIINNPLICAGCSYQLEAAHKFREKCLLTEKQINLSVKNLYLKSIEHFHNDTEVSNSQLEESHISPDSLNSYLNTSILEGLAEAAKEEMEKLKIKQIQPCHVELIDCLEDNSITDGEKVNTLNEMKIKEMPKNKCDVEQNVLECLGGKNMLNCEDSKRVYQKQRGKKDHLKAKDIKLHDVAESKQTNKMQSYASEQKLKEQNNGVTNKTVEPGCQGLIESQKIGASKTQYQNGGTPNGCKDEAENILKKKSLKMKSEAFKKYLPYRRGNAAVNNTTARKNNVYAKVYINQSRRCSDSVFEVNTKNVVDFQSQREIASRPKASSFENNIVNKNKRLLEKSKTAKFEKLEDFTTPVNRSKTQLYVNNLCHMCNIVINNVEIWKKHIRDHILTY